MSYIVDVRLNNNTIELVFDIIKTQTDRLHGLLNHNVEISCSKEEDILRGLFDIIKSAIRRKLKQEVYKSINSFQLSSEDIFNSGNGSIKINSPPTQAQMKLIDNLLKVLFSQSIIKGSNEFCDIGHDNLVLSVFIENIFVETYTTKLSHQKVDEKGSLNLIVKDILKNNFEKKGKATIDGANVSHQWEIYFYWFKDRSDETLRESLTEQFDKIDISDDNDSTFTDENARNDSFERFHLNGFQFSKEILGLLSITNLPDTKLENLWETLYYNDNLKQTVFNSAVLSLKLSQHRRKSDHELCNANHIINTNGLILLHGPPGTGKTSLCRAVSQKLSIRQIDGSNYTTFSRNADSVLIELSCSQIFSRWFGESSKNITTIFNDLELLLKSYIECNNFVCLLIDEVETIASCRTKLINNNESNESVRVVNCLLTNLDKLKKFDNFIVLATSNYLDTLDSAFVDRADRIFYVTKPSMEALRKILITTLENLLISHILNSNDKGQTQLNSEKYNDTIRLITEKCLVC